MTPRGRFIFAPAAKAFMKRRNDVSNAFGSSMRKTRLNVSWLGKPFLSTRTSSQRYAFSRATSAMSVQLVAPHSVASNAMNKISVKSCSAFSARGSGRSAKHSPNPLIGGSLRIRSHLQNPLSLVSNDLQKPTCDSHARKRGRGAHRVRRQSMRPSQMKNHYQTHLQS